MKLRHGIKFDVVAIVTVILLSVFLGVLLHCLIFYPPQVTVGDIQKALDAGKKVGDAIGSKE